MYDVVRAELFKMRKRPAVWVLLGVAVLITQLFAYVFPYVAYRSGDTGGFGGDLPRGQLLASTLPDQLVINSIGGFPVFAGALALVLGALMFGGEYGWGTVKTMLTQRPGRISVLGGQLVALGLALFAGVVVMFAVSAAGSAGIALAEDRPMDWPGVADLAAGVGAGWLVLAVWATLGAVLARRAARRRAADRARRRVGARHREPGVRRGRIGADCPAAAARRTPGGQRRVARRAGHAGSPHRPATGSRVHGVRVAGAGHARLLRRRLRRCRGMDDQAPRRGLKSRHVTGQIA